MSQEKLFVLLASSNIGQLTDCQLLVIPMMLHFHSNEPQVFLVLVV